MGTRGGTTGWSRGRGGVATGMMAALAVLAGGCSASPTEAESQTATEIAEASEADFSMVLRDLTDGLGLTEDQIAAVQEVMEEYRGRGREAGTLWFAASDLQEILTSDQVAAIEARRQELRAEREARRESAGEELGRRERGHRHGAGEFREGEGRGPGLPVDGLNLTEEQVEQLTAIREAFAPEMEEIRDALRDGSLTREEAATRRETIREAIHEAMQDILTEEQISFLEEHRAAAEERREGADARREEMRAQWEERREAEHAAMVSALGLSSEQVFALEALREDGSGEGRPSREEAREKREEHRQALLDILDDGQEEIWILHDSLTGLFFRHRARSRGGDELGTEGRRHRRGQRVRLGGLTSA